MKFSFSSSVWICDFKQNVKIQSSIELLSSTETDLRSTVQNNKALFFCFKAVLYHRLFGCTTENSSNLCNSSKGVFFSYKYDCEWFGSFQFNLPLAASGQRQESCSPAFSHIGAGCHFQWQIKFTVNTLLYIWYGSAPVFNGFLHGSIPAPRLFAQTWQINNGQWKHNLAGRGNYSYSDYSINQLLDP